MTRTRTYQTIANQRLETTQRPVGSKRHIALGSIGLYISMVALMGGILPNTTMAEDTESSPASRRTPIVDVFEKTHRAVINISSTQVVRVRQSPFDFFFEDDWDYGRNRYRKLTSIGSGFIIHASGYIITNAHVVDRASDVKVIFDDQRQYDAQTISIDNAHDLALLKIDTTETLTPVQLGSSSDLMIGETVVAIGNPLGYQHTLTTGVISATQREIELTNRDTGQPITYENLIQTDASINPGNSGGPLLNINGELIGINTAIRGDAQNIGFAIPVDTLRELLPSMLRAELKNRFALGMSIDEQKRIVEVWVDSPSDKAGLKVGDVITRLDQQPVESDYDLLFQMISHKPGDLLMFDVLRDDAALSMRVRLQEVPLPDGTQLAHDKLGLELQPLPAAKARELRIRADGALLVTLVEPNSPADVVGVKQGDVLTILGRYYVSTLDEVGQILEDVSAGDRIYLAILRVEGNTIYRDGTYVTIR